MFKCVYVSLWLLFTRTINKNLSYLSLQTNVLKWLHCERFIMSTLKIRYINVIVTLIRVTFYVIIWFALESGCFYILVKFWLNIVKKKNLTILFFHIQLSFGSSSETFLNIIDKKLRISAVKKSLQDIFMKLILYNDIYVFFSRNTTQTIQNQWREWLILQTSDNYCSCNQLYHSTAGRHVCSLFYYAQEKRWISA